MSVFEELELRAQHEARRALGEGALISWALSRLPAEPPSRARAECLTAVVALAVRRGEHAVASSLAPLCREGPRVDRTELVAACHDCAQPALALEVMEHVLWVERVERGPLTLPSLRVLARAFELAGRTQDALGMHQQVLLVAQERLMARAQAGEQDQGAVEVVVRTRAELARLLVLSGRIQEAEAQAAELLAVASEAGVTLEPREELVLARIELSASGRYVRVRGIERATALLGLSTTYARAALRLLVEHIDRVGPSLSAIEHERLAHALASARGSGMPVEPHLVRLRQHSLEEQEREAMVVRALAAGPEGRSALERARSVRDGGTAGPEPQRLDPRGRTLASWASWRALQVLVQQRERRLGEALAGLVAIEQAGLAPDVAGWTLLARAAPERSLREPVVALARRWLGEERGAAPALGFVSLAVRFERAGLDAELVRLALSRARAAHEPRARALAIQLAVRGAWAAHARGASEHAYRLLRSAIDDDTPRSS